MNKRDKFRQAMADRRIEDPMDGCWFTHGKREARRRARHALKADLRKADRDR